MWRLRIICEYDLWKVISEMQKEKRNSEVTWTIFCGIEN